MPTPATITEKLTVEDYRATPEGARCQLVEGELVMAPAPTTQHQSVTLNLGRLIADFLDRKLLGRVFIAPCDVYLSEHNVVQPDVLFVSEANAALIHDDGVHGAPDLVIEVLSPATAQLDAKVKRRLYAKHGCKELWLVDPLLTQIQIYEFARDTAKPTRLIAEHEKFTTRLLPGLSLAAATVFKR
jgi:Uma2 family endonuclease